MATKKASVKTTATKQIATKGARKTRTERKFPALTCEEALEIP